MTNIEWRKEPVWECAECDHAQSESELLRAPHPFQPGAQIVGCAQCRSVGALVRICDAWGCPRGATNGTPVPGGPYRQVCGVHLPRAINPPKEKP